jgi:hypothetical protein
VQTAAAFLDEERLAWTPFESLQGLSDVDLAASVEGAHGWAGRDLIAHLVAWLGDAIEVARELETGDQSATRERSRREFRARGDEINAGIQAAWRALPMTEVRTRMRSMRLELRERLAALPAARWHENPEDVRFFHIYTVEHYEDHLPDLEAVLGHTSGPRGSRP